MRALHIAVHLGGGVGKAHGAMAPHLAAAGVEQTFALLAEPVDRPYIAAIEATGARVVAPASRQELTALAADADVVQLEYWGHPALDGFFDGWRAPIGKPFVCWCHVSGLCAPFIPQNLVAGCSEFVATSPITLEVFPAARAINSGFGFAGAPYDHVANIVPRIAYLGTVNFKKLHPEFFAAIDALGEPVEIWGHVSRDARETAAAMRRPELARLRGYTDDPRGALSSAGIFFYPLRRDHYGTAENALVEAMSLGLVPVVFDNPAEESIVKDGYTGLTAGSMDGAVAAVERLMRSPGLRRKLSGNAMREVRRTRLPETSAQQFVALWGGLMADQRREARAVA